jgi:phenylalanyl-tRNA synthetase beta chain
MTCGVLAGTWHPASWNDPATPLDFFDGKGIIEVLARDIGAERFTVRSAEHDWLQPGRSGDVLVGGEVVGWLGEVHPLALQAFEATGPVTAFELALTPLIRLAKDVRPYTDVPKFPAVEFDLAIVVDEGVSADKLSQSIRSAGGKLLADARLFDVYRGAGVPQGKKSVAFALTYRALDKTLTAEEVEPQHERLVRKVLAAVAGELRS